MITEDTSLITAYPITSAEADMNMRLRLSSLVNFLIQSAIKSADQLGFGFDDLKEEHLFWVLSRLSLEIYRPLEMKEKAMVETWPKNIERIFYLRDFIVRDEKGEIVAKASSAWLAIDHQSKRPGNFHPDKMEIFTRLKDKYALPYSPEKLKGVSNAPYKDIPTSYYDIDLNQHVTACRYIDWMMDHFTIDFHRENYPKHLSINYLKETMPGETITLACDDASPVFCFEGFNPAPDKVAFRGQINFDL